MQKIPAMPGETLGEFSKHNCMLFFNEPVFQAYFHAKTRPALIGFQGYSTDLLGRALEWHSRGQRFDPAYLHQSKIIRTTSSRSEMGSDFALLSMISNPAANIVSASQKIINGSLLFQELRRASLENITSEQGVLLRLCRSIQVEGAFGLLKTDFGFRRFLARGKENIRTELFFLALAFDLKKPWMKRNKGRLRTHLSEISVA